MLAETMNEKMAYRDGERDMVAMHHELVADFAGRTERITSSLLDFGIAWVQYRLFGRTFTYPGGSNED